MGGANTDLPAVEVGLLFSPPEVQLIRNSRDRVGDRVGVSKFGNLLELLHCHLCLAPAADLSSAFDVRVTEGVDERDTHACERKLVRLLQHLSKVLDARLHSAIPQQGDQLLRMSPHACLLTQRFQTAGTFEDKAFVLFARTGIHLQYSQPLKRCHWYGNGNGYGNGSVSASNTVWKRKKEQGTYLLCSYSS
jgi:hypothetical protein